MIAAPQDAPTPAAPGVLKLGFIPLTDCAPLVAAHEKGFFEAEGLRVQLCRERSWASIRDKIAFGVYDAAQMLYPMPLAMSLGVGGPPCPTVAAACLSLNGNAITLSNRVVQALGDAGAGDADAPMDAGALRRLIVARRDAGLPPLNFGIVFPTSTHHYELRYWLESADIDPDQDVRLLVIPPPDMPEALRDGRIDGYCVGEPWNSLAVHRGWGRIAISKLELWSNFPEKVLGVTRAWADENPVRHLALVRAVLAAGRWCDDPQNREELARLIAEPRYVDAPADVVRLSLLGSLPYQQDGPGRELPDFHVFHRYAANFPWRSHGAWHLAQMVRAGQLDWPGDPEAVAKSVFLPEVYRNAARSLGLATPEVNHKTEGAHDDPWTLRNATEPIPMGSDRLLGGRRYDPDDPASAWVRQEALRG
ncbi:MAG: CmpA/NrtA family ABC transporter substrate-binding protein [Planctomycetota bacterium]